MIGFTAWADGLQFYQAGEPVLFQACDLNQGIMIQI